MNCPRCGAESFVTDTRHLEKENVIRRRRECPRGCDRFTTSEIIGLPNDMLWLQRHLKARAQAVATSLRQLADRVESLEELE